MSKYIINLSPQEAPRPRAGKRVFNPESYTRYKKDLMAHMVRLQIPKEDYRGITIACYMPYSMSTPDKDKVEAFHLNTPDWDNLAKPIMDALQASGIIKNDSRLSFGVFVKIMAKSFSGRTEFTLHTEEEVKQILPLLGIQAFNS